MLPVCKYEKWQRVAYKKRIQEGKWPQKTKKPEKSTPSHCHLDTWQSPNLRSQQPSAFHFFRHKHNQSIGYFHLEDQNQARQEEEALKLQVIAMATSSTQPTFLTGNPLSAIHKPKWKPRALHLVPCTASMHKDSDASRDKSEMKFAKLAIVTLAAGVLALGPVKEAMAAKTGGRVGGQAFRSAAPRPSGPRINNSRTNIFINPPVAPPLIGGYGYGAPFFGGWGWSPFTFFAPGPSVAVGIGGGFEVFFAIILFSTITAVIRRFTRGRDDDEDDSY